MYTGDIPSPPGTLHAALVYSKKALAKVKALEASDALTSPGATSFFCAKDCIAENVSVVNNIAGLEFREPLFAEETVHFVGECLGVLVCLLNFQNLHCCFWLLSQSYLDVAL